ncbi:hypothetical protein [Patulibacter sp. SYSU D01012]|uniref:hypothetical protein n=1 Tax=Patulibacter sp. SYSU D01012 TaxID=2817381 RepID=UPI001B311E34|nr:hypothetical protein [Patulibacter sp. SYSU D01012]
MPQHRYTVAPSLRTVALAGLTGPLLALFLSVGVVVSAETSHAGALPPAPALEASAR